ncbi:integumentary mucin C.1-like [Labeo rohita]|uniref:integumentary mucin C.1-like n=1 Tax=Labeo rohita TaxID=84645 RepID=UPI0021E2ABD2|nr:integumentary mucin C.1-like [Labeo rohita]
MTEAPLRCIIFHAFGLASFGKMIGISYTSSFILILSLFLMSAQSNTTNTVYTTSEGSTTATTLPTPTTDNGSTTTEYSTTATNLTTPTTDPGSTTTEDSTTATTLTTPTTNTGSTTTAGICFLNHNKLKQNFI